MGIFCLVQESESNWSTLLYISHLIMIKFSKLLIIALVISACVSRNDAVENEWVQLFNGRDLEDWIVKVHHHEVGVNFGNTFRAEDDMIKVRYDQYGDFNDQFSHLYFKQPFSHFHLKLEYRFVGELQKGAPDYTLRNSGVMFHSQDPRSMLKEHRNPDGTWSNVS